jgi:predicted hydrocarbon binding protein
MVRDHVAFPPRIVRRFVQILSQDLGRDTFRVVLAKAGLPVDWSDPDQFSALDSEQAAPAYAQLQSALRTYYGRGARGMLLKMGGKLWEKLLGESPLGLKTQGALIRGFPTAMRRKAALEFLPKVLGAASGDMTVHTLDLDLLFVDHASPTTLSQSDSAPICFVTHGLVRECLFWAMGFEQDIEEVSCRARGAKDCEFKICVGG